MRVGILIVGSLLWTGDVSVRHGADRISPWIALCTSECGFDTADDLRPEATLSR